MIFTTTTVRGLQRSLPVCAISLQRGCYFVHFVTLFGRYFMYNEAPTDTSSVKEPFISVKRHSPLSNSQQRNMRKELKGQAAVGVGIGCLWKCLSRDLCSVLSRVMPNLLKEMDGALSSSSPRFQ